MATDCTNKACRLCRLSHTACDGARPCRRCVALGKPELCQDVEPKKRGRPPKHFPATTEGGWRLTKKQKADAPSKSSSSEAAKVSNPPSPDSSPSHSPRSSCADLGLHSADRAGGDDNLLITLVNELRGTKQELKSEISAFYQTVERRLVQTEEKMNSILSMLPFNASSTVTSMPSSSPTHTTTKLSVLSASMRSELIRQLPFLADFNLDSSTPFVVDDLGKPVLAQRFSEATRVEDMLPPTIVWANDSFCSLMKVPLYDLLGRRGQGDARTAEMLLPYMLNRGSGLTGDILPLSLKWPRKDGKILTLRTRNQIFYNQSGWAKWLLMVVETAEEESTVRIQPAPATMPSTTPPYCFTHPHSHPHPHPHSHPHVHAHPHPHPHPHAHGHTHVHTPPQQQHFMGVGSSEEWRPHNEKEPFSFSAFPSCFSSLPFSLPPRFPGEPSPNTTAAAATTTIVSDAGGGGSGSGGLGQATTHQALGSFSSEQSPRTDTNKQGRGEAEMDELLSALISPNSFPTASIPTAAWEWDCA